MTKPKRTDNAVIGLEIHVQLDTRTKLFCGDAVRHDAPPNTDVCPVCLGLPGALPALNLHAVDLALRAAAMLQCTIHPASRFVRKNYFYPDLPKGYQITQLDEPIATGGTVSFASHASGTGALHGSGATVESRAVGISRIHLEEDAGKLLHDRVPGRTAIDLNRCGIPLLEIVTEPELGSAADAAAFARALKQMLQYAGIGACDMELGGLRIDANVSLQGGAYRSEIKNLNSFTQLEHAIDAEIARQRARRDAADGARSDAHAAESLANETLSWDADAQELRIMRQKEGRAEYRYLDEPDLPLLRVGADMIARACADVPEMPVARALRLQSHGLTESAAHELVATRALADYFERMVGAGATARAAGAWVLTDVLAWCNDHGQTIASYPVAAETLANVLARMDAGALTRDGARRVIAALENAAPDLQHGTADAPHADADIDALIDRLGVRRHVDEHVMNRLVDALISEQAALVARYHAGEKNLFGYLMGTLMTSAGAGTDPRLLAERLRNRLDEDKRLDAE